MKKRRIRKCKKCKKDFIPKSSHQLYCCKKCTREASNEHRRKLYLKFKRNPIAEFILCAYCGKKIKKTTSKKFCSDLCYRLFRNLKRRNTNKHKRELKLKTKELLKKQKSLSYSKDSFFIKVKEQAEGFVWEAFKANKLVLKSAEVFKTAKEALYDSKLAF